MCVSLKYIDQLISKVYIWCISGKCSNGHIHPPHAIDGGRDTERERWGDELKISRLRYKTFLLPWKVLLCLFAVNTSFYPPFTHPYNQDVTTILTSVIIA